MCGRIVEHFQQCWELFLAVRSGITLGVAQILGVHVVLGSNSGKLQARQGPPTISSDPILLLLVYLEPQPDALRVYISLEGCS